MFLSGVVSLCDQKRERERKKTFEKKDSDISNISKIHFPIISL